MGIYGLFSRNILGLSKHNRIHWAHIDIGYVKFNHVK
jgi:hypothetical protein